MTTAFSLGRAVASDTSSLPILMRELAQFEHYLEYFRVPVETLISRGLGKENEPQFTAYLVRSSNETRRQNVELP